MDTREGVANRAGTFDNPGRQRQLRDFATWAEANAWYWKYKQAGFGDAGKLDSNGDGLPCESLSGAPKVPTLPTAPTSCSGSIGASSAACGSASRRGRSCSTSP